MKKRGREALVDSKEVGFRRGETVLSSQSAFLATSSTSFLSWAPGDGDTYKCKTTHTHLQRHTQPHTDTDSYTNTQISNAMHENKHAHT